MISENVTYSHVQVYYIDLYFYGDYLGDFAFIIKSV